MFPFSQSVTPAVQDHMKAQFGLLSEMSQKLFDSAQKINELNMQVAKTVMDESLQNTHQVLTAQDPLEALSIATGQIQPTTEKVRAYQQHLTNIAAGTQVELTRAAESRVPEATRTATAVADEVTRRVTEETQKATERQRAMMEKVTNPVRASSASPSATPKSPGASAQATGAAR
jgi:phasin family protein